MSAPVRRTPVVVWLRRNLFRSWVDGVITTVAALVSAWVLYKSVNFVLVTGRWEVIERNLQLLMIGRYPADDVSRLAITVIVLSGWVGVIAGIVHARQVRAGRIDPSATAWSRRRVVDLTERFWIPALVILLLLVLTDTAGPWIMTGVAVVVAIVGRIVGPFIGRRITGVVAGASLAIVLAAVPIVLYAMIVDAVGFDEWGGFMLNVFLAACSIILCYPLGVLLALGRRSRLPLVRLVSTLYIELVRGAPLFVLLLFANVALGFFVPEGLTPSTPTRAIVVFTLFTAAYMAEIVRGGLQSVPTGQFEAAKALGLSPPRQTFLIVLPQALRNVIPAQIGQLISLFKDTALAGVAMGLFELLRVSEAITQQPDFRGQGLIGETLAFGAMLFWTVSYTMSRESQRLERKLGVGTR
ncbi:MAG: amino acid ABC transporter permease [Acidimicrobiaceae bacterium]|nr:amino acid ABC transporter permease [Acidimicrobiaceae bacterium]